MNRPVVIFQMGKVASSSMRQALSAVEGLEVVHTHHLNPDYCAELNARKRALGWRTTITPEAVHALGERLSDVQDLPVITLVREPVGRNISAFFNNLQVIYGSRDAHLTLSREELRDGFLSRYPHDIPLEWFDREVKPSLGIDVFDRPFPVAEGALRIDAGRVRLLVMRHDLDAALKQQWLGRLLGIDGIEIRRENVAADKQYGGSYQAFIEQPGLPRDYLERLLDSRYARHFFSAGERAACFQRWANSTAVGVSAPPTGP